MYCTFYHKLNAERKQKPFLNQKMQNRSPLMLCVNFPAAINGSSIILCIIFVTIHYHKISLIFIVSVSAFIKHAKSPEKVFYTKQGTKKSRLVSILIILCNVNERNHIDHMISFIYCTSHPRIIQEIMFPEPASMFFKQ